MSDGEEGDDEHTLTRHRSRANPTGRASSERGGDDDDDLRAYSTSPSHLDGGDIFNDLSEMSNFADRIDSILDQTVSEHSTRSGRMRSVSPMPQTLYEQEQQELAEEANNEEVD